MSKVDVQQLEATVTLPFPDCDRAELALRGWLRLAAADGGVHPDWSTMIVTDVAPEVDERGRTWWRWSGKVSPQADGAAATAAPGARTADRPPQA